MESSIVDFECGPAQPSLFSKFIKFQSKTSKFSVGFGDVVHLILMLGYSLGAYFEAELLVFIMIPQKNRSK